MNKMSIKGIALITSGLLVATVAGGTFALWNDSATAPSGTFSSGNLDVLVNSYSWKDVTKANGLVGDGTGLAGGAGAAINPATYNMVPGDTVIGTYKTAVALQGEHALANLNIRVNNASVPTGVSLAYRANGGAWTPLTQESTIAFKSADFVGNAPVATLVANNTILDGANDVTLDVDVRAYFDSSTIGTTSVNQVFNVGGLNVVLSQTAEAVATP